MQKTVESASTVTAELVGEDTDLLITPHAQRERGSVIGVGVHIY